MITKRNGGARGIPLSPPFLVLIYRMMKGRLSVIDGFGIALLSGEADSRIQVDFIDLFKPDEGTTGI
ncbi:hypothetical protein [Paenibacillus sp. NPDC057967]|uniref:hypothetical protein n=1 Tax=Paenibacillus sp. NPDC057967 TaxID=3346293 RepID=UPI0036DA5CAE